LWMDGSPQEIKAAIIKQKKEASNGNSER
jgi:hypothetical protein